MVIAHCSSMSLLIAIIFLRKNMKCCGTFKDKQCQIKKDIWYEMYNSQSWRLRKLCKNNAHANTDNFATSLSSL